MKQGLFIKQFVGTLVFYAAIFISAGYFMYLPGLVYAAIGVVMIILNYSLLKPDPELAAERSKPGEGAKKWDKIVLGLSFLATISMYCVAGLDSGRFHWSPDFSWILFAAGIILTISGQLLFLIAQKQNRFFSSTARIQTDSGHAVCDTGLYSFVRHPAYMGSTIQAIGFPLLFGSFWSIIPVSVLIILLIVRTALEDKMLQNELEGYQAYASKTRYRLIPFMW
ncbi:Isoprenylcysteine carboxyl methyltransferase (ICMT) family protein [anaerobic digester metagenome]